MEAAVDTTAHVCSVQLYVKQMHLNLFFPYKGSPSDTDNVFDVLALELESVSNNIHAKVSRNRCNERCIHRRWSIECGPPCLMMNGRGEHLDESAHPPKPHHTHSVVAEAQQLLLHDVNQPIGNTWETRELQGVRSEEFRQGNLTALLQSGATGVSCLICQSRSSRPLVCCKS